jgi:hypothetical protein
VVDKEEYINNFFKQEREKDYYFVPTDNCYTCNNSFNSLTRKGVVLLCSKRYCYVDGQRKYDKVDEEGYCRKHSNATLSEV